MKKLLIVDDSKTAKLLFKSYMPADSGYDIHEAHDRDTALAMAQEIRPDVVIMDYNMPERNGVEIAGDLRAAGIDAQYVLLTANTQASVLAAAKQAGFVTVLEKPITRDKISEALKRLGA